MSLAARLRLSALALAVALAGCGGDDVPAADEAEATGEIQSNETANAIDPDLGVVADTTGPARVTVAGQEVPARAVVTDMESSDRACMLTLRENGADQTVYADYSVCDSNAIVGQRVQIEYAPNDIPAASCEGDPECLDTETVAMAVVATPIDA